MKPIRFAITLSGLLLAGASLLSAQTPAAVASSKAAAAQLSQQGVAAMLQPAQSTTANDVPVDPPAPVQIVAQFLELQPAQQALFGELLQARQTAVTPIFQAIALKELQVQALLNSGGNPAQVGILVTQIYALQHQIVQTQQVFLANLANLLDQDQKQKLAGVTIAAQLQPVLPAFQALQLF